LFSTKIFISSAHDNSPILCKNGDFPSKNAKKPQKTKVVSPNQNFSLLLTEKLKRTTPFWEDVLPSFIFWNFGSTTTKIHVLQESKKFWSFLFFFIYSKYG